MLLVVLVVAAFLGGREVLRRELMSEVSSIRKELKDLRPKPTTSRLAVQSVPVVASKNETERPSDHFKSIQVVQKGGVREATTVKDGSGRYLALEGGMLGWSQRSRGRSGYFYADYGGESGSNSPKWQFARASSGDLLSYANKTLVTTFDNPNAFQVEVGQTWLARTWDDPQTIYLLTIKSQEENEEMTVEYVILQAQESTRDSN
jgi:hypothetical protein